MTRRGLAAVLCSFVFVAVACGGDDDQPTPATAAPTASEAAPTATPCVLDGATTEVKETNNDPDVSPMIEIRTTGAACPRVVFEFEDQIADYKVSYIDPPATDCGSGEEVDTSTWDAGALMEVRLEPSGGPDITSEEGEPTYKGSRDIAVEENEILKHLKVSCDFEAVFTWVIGVDEERPFTVTTLQNPPRLVVEISQA